MANTRMVPPVSRRANERRQIALPARLTWKDASGAVRFVSVTTRDLSREGVFVEAADGSAAIPLYRLVHLQLERPARETVGIPDHLRDGRVLSAVWRVGPYRASSGKPAGYALRFLLEPQHNACRQPSASMAVAS